MMFFWQNLNCQQLNISNNLNYFMPLRWGFPRSIMAQISNTCVFENQHMKENPEQNG